MIWKIYVVLLPLLLAANLPANLGTHSQDHQQPDVPEKLKIPGAETVILHARGSGSQVYTCQAGSDGKMTWTLKAPEADLYDSKGQKIGKHYAGPTWKYEDGSEVTGKVVARQDAPDPESIPWLLLSASGHSGAGKFASVDSIQRIRTKGGQPPKLGCDESHRGSEIKVPYSADYYFYAASAH